MKLVFRWFGHTDRIPLSYIGQIPGADGIVSAVYDVPVGDIWPDSSIKAIKDAADSRQLSFEVVESVPIHEDIKLGKENRDLYIEHYCENIRRLAGAGVKVICYNFMPIFDWVRSDLSKELSDGSTALSYDDIVIQKLDPKNSTLTLPGWDESYTKEGLHELLDNYTAITEEILWEHYAYFLAKIIPVCEESGMKMAVHPDDPPWNIFGLPRILKDHNSYARLAEINPSPANGITLCLGSLGANPDNDILDIIHRYHDRIHFVHARNIRLNGNRNFVESPHPSAYGSIDMYAVLKALYDTGFDGYMRPDHGRMIWGEDGRPGYGLYDRALGLCYLNGLWEAITKNALTDKTKAPYASVRCDSE
jgi:mannonate dehydratase